MSAPTSSRPAEGCGAFAEAAARSRARMVIGEERRSASSGLPPRSRMPPPREDRPGPARLRDRRAARAGRHGLREATLARPRPARARLRPGALRGDRARSAARATRRASAGARRRRSARGARGSGPRTGRSCSRPRRRRGRRGGPAPAGLGRSAACATAATASAGCATSAAGCSSGRRRSACSCARQRAGDPRLRVDRHAPHDRLPEPHLLRPTLYGRWTSPPRLLQDGASRRTIRRHALIRRAARSPASSRAGPTRPASGTCSARSATASPRST